MRVLTWGLTAAVCLLSAPGTAGAVRAEDRDGAPHRAGLVFGDGGSSSRDARESARRAVPLERLAESDRRDVERILRNPTLYRRLPRETFTCDRELLEFSLEKPEVIVDLWRVLGISRLRLDRTGPGAWRMSDGWGTEGTLRVLHHERTALGGTLLLHGKGGYKGPLAPQPLTGSCLVLVRHGPSGQGAEGSDRHAMQVDAYLDADGVGLEIVTRTLQPLVCRSSASNLHEICQFMQALSDAAGENPEGVAILGSRLTNVDPRDGRTFASLARGVGHDASAVDPIAERKLPSKLAARWLPARQLEAEQIR